MTHGKALAYTMNKGHIPHSELEFFLISNNCKQALHPFLQKLLINLACTCRFESVYYIWVNDHVVRFLNVIGPRQSQGSLTAPAPQKVAKPLSRYLDLTTLVKEGVIM